MGWRDVGQIAALLLAGWSFLATCQADDKEPQWGVSPYVGLYQPRLGELDRVLADPYISLGSIVNATGAGTETLLNYYTPAPKVAASTLAGLEFQWRVNDKFSLLMGGGHWETYSNVQSTGLIPIQGQFETLTAKREDDLYYNEYYLGLRYNFYTKAKKYRFYWSTTLHQLYDINFRESFTGVFLSGPPASFTRTVLTTAQATGLPVVEGMLGGERFLTRHFSIGMEAGFDLALKRPILTNGVVQNDILATDNVTLRAPTVPDANGHLAYQPKLGGNYYDETLNFNGWKTLIKVTLYY